MDPAARALLLRDNPWIRHRESLARWLEERLPEPFVPRLALRDAERLWRHAGRAHLLVGPRQAGKSSALWAHLRALGRPALYLDCELGPVRALCESPPLFLEAVERLVGEPVPLLLDEVQHLQEAGLFLKGLVDRRYRAPILVTGSASFHLRSRTRESLAGRATRARLFPFSLAEVCQDLDSLPAPVTEDERARRLHRHLVNGGYPAVWLGEDPAPVLADLVEAFVLRDARDLFRVARPDAFRRLLRLVAGQVGSLVNAAEWSSLLGVSRDTVVSYLALLAETHVLVTLPPFSGGRRSELTGRPKVFFVDPGLRNYLLGALQPFEERADKGPLLEQWVFSELWKALPADATLHFWRSTSGAEVDFVAVKGERPVGVEVKATELREPRLPRACRSFIEAYEPRDFLLVNLGLDRDERLGETRVRFVTPPRLASVFAAA